MPSSATPLRYFTWLRFAKIVFFQVAMLGVLVVFKVASVNTAVAVFAALVWINISCALRWQAMGKQELSGELSLQDYRSDPQKYFWASKAHWRITVWGGALVMFVCVLVSNFF